MGQLSGEDSYYLRTTTNTTIFHTACGAICLGWLYVIIER